MNEAAARRQALSEQRIRLIFEASMEITAMCQAMNKMVWDLNLDDTGKVLSGMALRSAHLGEVISACPEEDPSQTFGLSEAGLKSAVLGHHVSP